MFGQESNLEEALRESIRASIGERNAALCDTWDAGAALALPWGVKEAVSVEQAQAVSEFMENIGEIEVDGRTAKILKAGVKERNGQATLIFRYQLV